VFITHTPEPLSHGLIELIADVKEWERRMRLREFFFDQNEKEDVLTDDQKQYNTRD
jgi:hypothetical protein